MVPGLPRAVTWLAAALVAAAAWSAGAAGLVNGGFDEANANLPAGWVLDDAVKRQGEARVVDGYAGAHGKVLKLSPNGSNRGAKLLGVGQVLDATPFQGKRVAVRARLAALRAQGIVGVHVLGPAGDLGHVQLTSNSEALKPQESALEVPAAAKQLIVYAVVQGTSGEAVFDDVELSLIPAGSPASGPATSAPALSPSNTVRIDVDTRKVLRRVPPTIFGVNVEWIWDGQGLWSAGASALDPVAVKLTRALGPTLIRFPGGVFSDSYHWREGLGPEGSRPLSEHSPKGPRSPHHFGTGEVSQFARETGAGLLITVNAASGTAAEAAEWVRYMNRGTGPAVQWWEVGNELYMSGDASGGHLTASEYAKRFVDYASQMRRVDPNIRIGAIGGLNQGSYRFIADPDWTRVVLEKAAAEMDFLAVHNAYAPVLIGTKDLDPREVYRTMLAAPAQIESNLARVSELLRRYERPGHPIGIAVTEWGPLFHVSPDSPWIDHAKTMGSALFTASALNVFMRSPRVQVANFFKLNEASFMGLIGRRGGEWAPTASYEVFALYRRNVREQLVDTRVDGPTYTSRALGVVDAVARAPFVDAVATTDAQGLTIIAVNKSGTAMKARIALGGFLAGGTANVESVSADDLDANTGTTLPVVPGLKWAPQVNIARFDRGAPGEIHVARESLEVPRSREPGGELELTLRPYSATSISIRAAPSPK